MAKNWGLTEAEIASLDKVIKKANRLLAILQESSKIIGSLAGKKKGQEVVVFTQRFLPGGYVLLIDENTQRTKNVRAYTQEGYL